METTSDRAQRVSDLLHDAEHAESGADFAEMMARRDPAGGHELYAKELREKRDRLVAEALALDPERTTWPWEETSLEVPHV